MLLSVINKMKEFAVSQPIRKHSITPFAFLPTLPELQLGQAHSFCHIQSDTKKTGTFEMRSGNHVQLAVLRNRDLELQTTSPFSNHGSVERSTACFRHKYFFGGDFYNFCWVGFSKVPVFLCHPVLLFCLRVKKKGKSSITPLLVNHFEPTLQIKI
jgi:hypothetical protein